MRMAKNRKYAKTPLYQGLALINTLLKLAI